MLKAVIFDMDGVIIDSEPMHARAAVLTLKQFHVNITLDYLAKFIGTTDEHMCQQIVRDFNMDVPSPELQKAYAVMKEQLLKLEGYTVIPYVTDLIKDLYKNGVKLSIASSSTKEVIEEVMEVLHIKEFFQSHVSGVDVAHPKPAPDIFLEAAARLGCLPEECIVIEDSFLGVTAASAAGMTCIGYVNPHSGKQDLSKASLLAEGFDEIDYDFLNNIYQFYHAPSVILTSEKFIIRELTEADIPVLYKIYQKPGMREFLDDLQDTPEVETVKHKAYIQNIYHFYGYGLWGVFLKESGQLIGRCGIEFKMLDGKEVYELGYLLDPDYQGLGYAKEFVTEVLNYCFKKLDIHRITAVIDQRNIRSCCLAKQVGMIRIGECRRDNRDCYQYEITYHQ